MGDDRLVRIVNRGRIAGFKTGVYIGEQEISQLVVAVKLSMEVGKLVTVDLKLCCTRQELDAVVWPEGVSVTFEPRHGQEASEGQESR